MDYTSWKSELEAIAIQYGVDAKEVLDFAYEHDLYTDGYDPGTAFDDWRTNQELW